MPEHVLAAESTIGSARIAELLEVQRLVTLTLAESGSLRMAAPRLLGEICRGLGWEWGAFWRIQGREGVLVCREIWTDGSSSLGDLVSLSREARCAPGVDVVGRVWAGGTHIGVPDGLAEYRDWGPRTLECVRRGARAVLCFPVISGRCVVGVIELLGTRPHDLQDGSVPLLVAVSSQIGQFIERKKAFDEVERHARELEKQKAFVERLMGIVPAGIAYLDRSLVVRWANPQLAKIFRRPVRALVDRPLREVLPEARIRRMAQRVLVRGGTQRICGLQARQATGDTFWDVVVSPVGGAEDPGGGLLLFVMDVSERIGAQRLQERQMAEYAKIDQIKSDFLNATSHELRTPLSIILGYAEFLGDEIGGPLTEEQEVFVTVTAIEEAAHKLQRLVDDMLDFARMEAGAFRLDRRSTDLVAIVKGVVMHLEGLAEALDVKVTVEVPENRVRLVMDPLRISRVVRNLVSNAIKFNRPGGSVVVRLIEAPRSVRVEVQDTGIGIPPEHREKIFEKFYQVDPSSTRSRGGAGLGLSIARALVQAHKGRIRFRSMPGEGSTFWFTLPRSDPSGGSAFLDPSG